MLTVIITAYNEPLTISKAIKSIVRPFYSGIPDDFEIIQVSPDEETLKSGLDTLINEKWAKKKYIQIKDPGKGKPHALNLAFKKAQGEIIILTDGDVYFAEDAISYLLSDFHNPKIGGVTGRIISQDSRKNIMGYYSHLLVDAAHHKRLMSMTDIPSGKSEAVISRDSFFPLSGYIMAIRNIGILLPEDVLADDAYISYKIAEKGYKLSYKSDAKVYVKYPKTISDYLLQKKRSLGGYIQLWKYGVVTKETKARSFWHELQYFWFPFKYAKTFREYIWSGFLYPIRFYTWVKIWWERKIKKKSFEETWKRVESTK